MAIAGTDSFDVTEIDVDTLTLSRADGVGGVVTPLTGPPGPGISIDDVATPFLGEPCDCHNLAGDGIDDLVLKFSTPELVDVLELGEVEGDTFVEFTLSGVLLDGTPFGGSDCVVVQDRHGPTRLPKSRRPR